MTDANEPVPPYRTTFFLTKNKRQLYSDNGFGFLRGKGLIKRATALL